MKPTAPENLDGDDTTDRLGRPKWTQLESLKSTYSTRLEGLYLTDESFV